MKKILSLLSLLFFLNSSIACKKGDKSNNSTPLSPANCGDTAIVNKLIGEWQWLHGVSSGDIYIEENPTECNCSRGLIFYSNCNFQYLTNDIKGSMVNFSVKYDSSVFHSYVLGTYGSNINNCLYNKKIKFTGDTLILTTGVISSSDYGISYYIKKNNSMNFYEK